MPERGASLVAIPERGDPDRKRALNVLAQRRYRQKRREKIQSLENQANSRANALPPPQVAPICLTSPVSQPVPFKSLGMPTPAQDDVLPNPEEFANQRNLTCDGSDLTSDSNVIYSAAAMTALVDFDMASFSLPADFGSELQSLEISQFTFPDDGNLNVPELQVMKAGLNIAEILGCADTIWDFSALRVLEKSAIATPFLPRNLEPTEVQRRIPHHPLFDLFPWPSVRSKFIIIFSQPVQLRPPIARDPMALVQMFYDMDDSAEGLRISGSDWHSAEDWEVGQAFFTNWWWALDRSVVDSSNLLRAKRGAPKLVLGPP